MKETDKNYGLTVSQETLLAALLLAAIAGQEIQTGGKKKYFRQRTKMGLFTYRGGKVAAIIQYFLFGIVVPALPVAVLAVLQMTTDFLPQPHAPWISFIAMVYVSLWVFYLGRGLSMVFGMASSAFGHFLDIMLDLGLIAALVKTATLAFGLQEVPVWLRIVSCLAALLIQLVGSELYGYLKDDEDETKTRIRLSGEDGTPDKIFFHTLTKLLKWPTIGFSFWWILELDLPLWSVKALWIAAFVLVYYIVWIAFVCNGLSYENSRRYRKGGRLAKFLLQFHTWMFIPALVLMLHWTFSWFPMKLWVIIVLSIYTLFFLISSIGVAMMKG